MNEKTKQIIGELISFSRIKTTEMMTLTSFTGMIFLALFVITEHNPDKDLTQFYMAMQLGSLLILWYAAIIVLDYIRCIGKIK